MKMKFVLNIILCAVLLSFSSQYEVVKIGAIFFHDEKDLMEALDIAIHDINQYEYEVRLQSVKHFISIDDSLQLQEIACDLIENGVAAIFGPSSKATSDIVAILCNITGIPHLQFDTQDPVNDLQRRNHRMTVNLAPDDLLLSSAYWDILRSSTFDWKSFTIVYETSSSLNRMQHLFAWKQLHRNGIKIRKFKRGDDYRILWKNVSNTREKFIVLDCPPDIVVDVVNASIFFNMTGPFNNLFLINLDTHLSNLEALYSNKFSAPTNAVRMRSYLPPPTQHELDVFEDVEEEKIVSLRSQLIYDAVVLYYNAVRNLARAMHYFAPQLNCARGFWKPGVEIMQQMKILTPKNVTPPFKTQKVHINKDGVRDDFNLEIYNPFMGRVSHVWNKHHLLVSFDELVENATKKATKRKQEEKEDFSLKRVRYTVATRVGEPYFMWRKEPEGVHYEGNERFEGYAVDLIYKLAEECRFDFIFEPVPDNGYGSYDPLTDEWNGIIRALIDNDAQIGICDLTITQARRSVVDFTVPFMQLGVSLLYYRQPPPPKNLFGFLKPYALGVWMYLLIALLLTSVTLVVMARLSKAEWRNQTINERNEVQVENVWNIVNTFWLMIGSIMLRGCDILPRGIPMRVFTTFWWIFALLITQTYIAKLASFITSSKMEGTIRNLHDLVDQNKIQFGTVKGGSTSVLFSESNESDYRVAWNKMIAMRPEAFTASSKEGVDRVKRSRGRYAFLMETTTLQYYVQRNCELTQIGEPFGEKHYGIAVPLHAPFRSNLSVGILKLSEKGVLYTLKNKWFNSNDTDCDLLNAKADGGIKFNMESVGGLFIVLIAGVLVALVIAIIEFLTHVLRIAVAERVSLWIALKAELLFFLCFWIKRKPRRSHLRISRPQSVESFPSAQISTLESGKKKVGRKKKVEKSDQANK